MTVMEGYELASRILESETARTQTTAGMFVDDRNQVRRIPKSTPFEHMPPDQRPAVEPVVALQGLGGRPCLEHREKVHTFADGAVMQCCTATDCFWGKVNPTTGNVVKRHSDGTKAGTVYADIDDPEELSPDEPQELGAPVVDDAVEDCLEDDEVSRVERAADDAATEGDDEGEDDITDEE